MKSIITTYPACQTLPREIKIMVLAMEGHVFDKTDSQRNKGREKVLETTPGVASDVTIRIQSAGCWS
ncbi:MAG: hypothetical protein WBS33_17500 [Verrucomicrobiia bacterium]